MRSLWLLHELKIQFKTAPDKLQVLYLFYREEKFFQKVVEMDSCLGNHLKTLDPYGEHGRRKEDYSIQA